MTIFLSIRDDQLTSLSTQRRKLFLDRLVEELKSDFPSWPAGWQPLSERNFVEVVAKISHSFEIFSEEAIARLAQLTIRNSLELPWSPRLCRILGEPKRSEFRRVDAFERNVLIFENDAIVIDLESDLDFICANYE